MLFVPRGDDLTPVAATVDLDTGDLAACETLAGDVRRGLGERRGTVEIGQGFAFEVSDQAIVAGLLPIGGEPSAIPLAEVAASLGDNAVKARRRTALRPVPRRRHRRRAQPPRP
ncbi:hypothetical protein G5V59_06785 [Nocardioides sp. W3-2-3]|uniref:hypothetical protein n=1 Tax=Nocardioides convexus TaxID=2712224 RepID=UPI0024186814|nr:hypothetical protein [Nocardioides convexus]NHA00016.1 hypothetical protein [Nocardioides convexus]